MKNKKMSRKDNKGRVLKDGESQRNDFTYMYRYTDIDKKRKTVYAGTLDELRKKEEKISENLKIDIFADSNLTVHKLLKDYLADKMNLAANTENNYVYCYERYIRGTFLEYYKVTDLNKRIMMKFYKSVKDKNIGNGTIHILHNLLYPAMEEAVESKIISFNPCKNCMKEFPIGEDAEEKIPLSIKEQKKLLEFIKGNKMYKRYYALFYFMLSTGCRIGETIGLTWDDIKLDEENPYVSINHQLIYGAVDKKFKFYINKPKTKSGIRYIPISEKMKETLIEYKNTFFNEYFKEGIEIDGYSGFVFITKNGTPQKPNTINRVILSLIRFNNEKEIEKVKEEKDRVLLPHFSCHSLRHTACTRMSESGINPKVIQYIMGHSNYDITMNIYNHADFERAQTEFSNKAFGI